jgi:hypothetical protein
VTRRLVVAELPALRLGLEPADVGKLSPEAIPALLVELAALQTAAAARLAGAAAASREAATPPPEPSRSGGDCLLTAAQLGQRLGKDARYVYRRAHSPDWSGITVKAGKSLLFSEHGLAAWIERHRLEHGD